MYIIHRAVNYEVHPFKLWSGKFNERMYEIISVIVTNSISLKLTLQNIFSPIFISNNWRCYSYSRFPSETLSIFILKSLTRLLHVMSTMLWHSSISYLWIFMTHLKKIDHVYAWTRFDTSQKSNKDSMDRLIR